MHVHTVIDSLTTGGAENLLRDYIGAAENSDLEISVSYLYGDDDDGGEKLRALGLEPNLIGFGKLLRPAALSAVETVLRRVAPDVVHTHLTDADAIGLLAARRVGVPSVCTVHSAAVHGNRKRQVREYLAHLGRRFCASRVITVSEASKAWYLDASRDDPGHVEVIHNGIADPQSGGGVDGSALRAEFGIGPEEIVFTTVSMLRPGKGHLAAVDLIAALRERGHPARLLVTGAGELEGQVRDAIDRKLGEAGTLIGLRDDIPAVLDASDVVLHPTDADAFPTALIEAAAASLPALATRVGGVPEIAVDGATGFLFDPPAGLEQMLGPAERLCAEPGLRKGFGAAARDRYESEFSAARWVERLGAVYASVARPGA